MHFLAIDGLNIVRRVYGAIRADDSPEKVTGALKSSLASIRRGLTSFNPTHAAFILDAGGVTWRHQRYPGYKAGRKPMYQPLRDALPAFQDQLLQELGLRTICVPGVEADDVLMSLADTIETIARDSQRDLRLTILSTDKDIAACASERVRVYDQFMHLYHDEEWCLKKFGVKLSQLLDLLALVGDDVDGIPGVEKIGVGKAAKWLNSHGDLKGVLEAAAHSTSADGVRIAKSADQVRLARELLSYSKVPLGAPASEFRLSVRGVSE